MELQQLFNHAMSAGMRRVYALFHGAGLRRTRWPARLRQCSGMSPGRGRGYGSAESQRETVYITPAGPPTIRIAVSSAVARAVRSNAGRAVQIEEGYFQNKALFYRD
jgi:hypothetical protein